MIILDGKQRGAIIVDALAKKTLGSSTKPKLGVILIGNDPASHIYVNLKETAARRAGIEFEKKIFPETATKLEILNRIREWNTDTNIHGILLQVPLPDALRNETDELIEAIDPTKDVDGFHRINTDRFLAGDGNGVYPVFPRAIMELLLMAEQNIFRKKAAIICNSLRFGEMMREALRRDQIASDIILQERLPENSVRIKQSDIVITACGVPNLLTGEMVKSGAIVIDGGITKLPDGKIVGDVDRASMEGVEGWLSPVPGGVGPVTVACLLRNVVEFSAHKKTKA